LPSARTIPDQADELGDAQASGIADLDQDSIATGWSAADEQPHFDLGDDALGD
jgi:hypothetical protein